MEESQKIHIETYLPELTNCVFLSALFLSKLQDTGFLSDKDMEVLEAERHDNGTHAESRKFFEIMLEKNLPGTYEAILEGVRNTHQAQALKILEKVRNYKSDEEENAKS